MKRIGLILVCVCIFRLLSNGNPQNDLFEKANDAYVAGSYSKAIELYRELLSDGYRSATIYYNLGNAYLKADKLGKAILFYEKARLHAPGDPDIQYNLQFARNRVTDRMEPLPEFFLTRSWNDLRMFTTSENWIILALVCWWAGFLGLILWLKGGSRSLRKLGFFTGILLLLLSLLPFMLSYSRTKLELHSGMAIITSSEATLRSSPDESGKKLYILREGEKVELKDRLGDWWLVELGNGETGWLVTKGVEEI